MLIWINTNLTKLVKVLVSYLIFILSGTIFMQWKNLAYLFFINC